MKRVFLLLTLATLVNVTLADALFDDDATLSVSLTAPFDRIEADRDKSEKYPGLLNLGGQDYQVDIQVRGNKRLSKSTCSHPPLRVDFRKKEIKDTLFDAQNDLKLVVLCRRGSAYEAYLRAEYLVYRALNQLTDVSYRVRWIDISYRDSDKPEDIRAESAFFVERKSRVAKRAGLEKTDVRRISISQLEQRQAALVSLFQYVVANPDFSLVTGIPGDDCCHNAKLLTADSVQFLPIIYDFDSSGVVNARYAAPHESLRIRKVTQRLYRGYCAQNDAITAIRSEFLAKREAVIAVFENDALLDGRQKKHAVKFLNGSFDRIESDRRFNSQIIKKCR